ncbi:MAG: DUF1674 domain-containing protein [Rickettsiales bacterium]|nr:MAG: DUF1674 domain-containing protein [Rickettsiales bacterium]
MLKKDKSDNTPTNEESSSKNTDEEFGGQNGPDPTRYGDWEKNGRVSDF